MPESNNSICILSPPMQLSNRCRVRALKSFFPLSPGTSGNHFIQSNPREIHRPHAESVLHYHIKNHPRVVAIVPDDDWVYSPSRGLLRLLRRVPFSLTDCLRVASERERKDFQFRGAGFSEWRMAHERGVAELHFLLLCEDSLFADEPSVLLFYFCWKINLSADVQSEKYVHAYEVLIFRTELFISGFRSCFVHNFFMLETKNNY